MKINSEKIPLKFKTLPEFVVIISNHGERLLSEVRIRLRALEGMPSSSNASFSMIADELEVFHQNYVNFKFYGSRNPFSGKNVISHATNGFEINYNTRFHAAETFAVVDWVANFFHELTHLADQRSKFSFGHDGQNDYNAAPMVVSRIARKVFQEFMERNAA